MPEAQLPTTEVAARPMFAALDTPLAQSLEELKARLTKNGLTRMIAEDAQAWNLEAQKYLTAADQSDAAKAKASAFNVHRFLSAMFTKATKPVVDGRIWANQVVSSWNRKVAAEEAEKRRQNEEAQKKEQERQRLEEAAALEAQGHPEEAEAHLNAPLPPPSAPTEKVPAAKVGGSGRSETTVFKIDADKPISDHKAFYTFIAEHPEYAGHIELIEGKWKRTLTDAKSKDSAGNFVCLLAVPGLNIVSDIEGRSRG
jgi:hypothetical protein